MIKLTRLNGEEFVVNADLIRFVERRPDTYVTLTSSDRFIVREPVEEVVKRALAWTRAVRARGAATDAGADWSGSASRVSGRSPDSDG